MSRLILSIFACVSIAQANAQGITGSWEGEMGHEKLQLNVQEKDGRLCGYTYDHFLNDRTQYCRAYFSGTYEASTKIYTFTGTSFISNSGSHTLIKVKVRRERIDGETVLRGYVSSKSSFVNILTLGTSATPIILRRVSSQPKQLADGMPVCEETRERNRIPEKKPAPPETKEDDLEPVPAPPVTPQKIVPKKDTEAIIKPNIPVASYKSRSNKEIKRLEVDVPVLKIKVYDNGVVDGDTVSIYFNDRLVVDRKLLSETPIELELQLDRSWTNNQLLLYAHNLGSIPPNTAIIIVTAGKQRYELLSGQDLNQNAVLYFDYKPKD